LLPALVLLLALLILGLTTALPAHAQAAAPRNVVFILSDDHRYDFMSFHPQARTSSRHPSSTG